MSTRVAVSRVATIPDELRIARCLRAPELGPRLLFLSGGSALRPLSRALKQYTHNSVHLITAFDSGGSSAPLRRAFAMPGIGDLRNRIVALADESVRGNPEIYRFFCHRLPMESSPDELLEQLIQLVEGNPPLVTDIPEPMRQIVRTHLRFFLERKPSHFDLRGANLGNLMLAGGFLANSRDLDSVLFLFSKLLEVRGTVRPIVDVDLHLCAQLNDGSRCVGQHLLTGQHARALPAPIRDLQLVSSLDSSQPACVAINAQTRRHLERAELICLPMGSFYTSVIANLLPSGVGGSIVAAQCPRVYIPNTGCDPEQQGLSLVQSLRQLAQYIRRDAGMDTPIERIVNIVILDSRDDSYEMSIERESLQAMGVAMVECQLVADQNGKRIDPKRLAEVLLSLV